MARAGFPLKPKPRLQLAILLSLALLAGFSVAGIPAGAASTGQPIPVSWSNPGPLGTPPPSTDSHVLTPGPGDSCILFGGWKVSGDLTSDAYQVDAAGRWSKIAATGAAPPPLASAAGVYDEPGNRLVIFGGLSLPPGGGDTISGDLYALDLTTKVWTKLNATGTPPAPRLSHSAVFDSLRRRMVVFGGVDGRYGGMVFKDAYALNLATLAWSKLSPSSGTLPARRSHTAAYLPDRDAMAIFGGENEPLMFYNTLHLYSFADNTVKTLPASGSPHPAVVGAASAYDPASDRLLIFGGCEFDLIATLSAVNVDSGLWETLNAGAVAPGPRWQLQMAALQKPNRFLLFGGDSYGGGSPLDDTWILTLGERVPVQLSGFAAE